MTDGKGKTVAQIDSSSKTRPFEEEEGLLKE